MLLVGAGVKQVFPLGVPAARGCATAHRPVHETVPGAQTEGLQVPPSTLFSLNQALEAMGGIRGCLTPASWAKRVPFQECPGEQWVAAGIHVQADPWVGRKQESGPFLGVHNKGGLAVRPCP